MSGGVVAEGSDTLAGRLGVANGRRAAPLQLAWPGIRKKARCTMVYLRQKNPRGTALFVDSGFAERINYSRAPNPRLSATLSYVGGSGSHGRAEGRSVTYERD